MLDVLRRIVDVHATILRKLQRCLNGVEFDQRITANIIDLRAQIIQFFLFLFTEGSTKLRQMKFCGHYLTFLFNNPVCKTLRL